MIFFFTRPEIFFCFFFSLFFQGVGYFFCCLWSLDAFISSSTVCPPLMLLHNLWPSLLNRLIRVFFFYSNYCVSQWKIWTSKLTRFLLTSSCAFSAFLSPRSNVFSASKALRASFRAYRDRKILMIWNLEFFSGVFNLLLRAPLDSFEIFQIEAFRTLKAFGMRLVN